MNGLETIGTSLEAFSTLLIGQALDALPVLLVALLASRLVKHGAIVHVLWLLVLIKLLTPALFQLPVSSPWLPSLPLFAREVPEPPMPPVAPPAPTPAELMSSTAPSSVHLMPSEEGVLSAADLLLGWSPWAWLGLCFAVGSVFLATLGLRRSLAFRRQLRRSDSPDVDLIRRLHALAEELGLDAVPRTRILEARLSPMLWTRLGGTELLLPASLLNRLGHAELDAVLAHELAHLKRRDHWMRVVEMLAVGFFWWHPLLGLVRRHLHQAEERACDVWVQRLLPGSGRSYAGALLKTLEFLRPSVERSPALACAIQPKNDWKERLTMIVTEKTAHPLRVWQRGLLALLVILLLGVVPTLAGPEPLDDGEPASIEEAEKAREALQHDREAMEHEYEAVEHSSEAVERSHEALERSREALERQREALERDRQRFEAKHLALEEQMVALQQREVELETKQHETERDTRTAFLEAEAAKFESRGFRAEAANFRAEAERIRQQAALVSRHLKIEREQASQRRMAELELRRAHLQAAELRTAGEDKMAAKLEQKIEEQQREVERLAQAEMAERLALDRVEIARQREHMKADLERLRRDESAEAAAEMERALADLAEAEAEIEARAAELEAENEP